MFSNFKNAFVRRTQYTIEPPKAVTDVINTEVPEGFEYRYMGDGMYVLLNDSRFGVPKILI